MWVQLVEYTFVSIDGTNTIIDLSALPNLINHPLNGVAGMQIIIGENPF